MTFLTVARSATVAAGLLMTGGIVLSAVAADASSSPGTAYAQNDRRGGGQGDRSDDNKPKAGTPAVPAQQGNRGRGPAQAQPNQRQPNRGAERGNQRPDRVVRQKPQQPARQPEARNTTPRAERPVVRTDNRGNGRPAATGNAQRNDRPNTRDNAQRNDRPATRDAERNDRPVDRTGPGRNGNSPARRDQAQFQQYRHNYTATRRFQVGIYRWNSGRSYRRYGYGESLPNYYYTRDYWLADFLMYGLFAPPPGLIWVRYGPDALLIDEETGEIYQVRYNIFYS
jgi:Ni/Co efflux regulator RcnB